MRDVVYEYISRSEKGLQPKKNLKTQRHLMEKC